MARAGRQDDPVEDELGADEEVEELSDDLEDLEDVLDEDADEEELPEGFTVVDAGEGDAVDDDDEALGRTAAPAAVDDDDRAAAVIEAATRGVPPGEDDDDEDDLAVQRAGEFVCRRCYLVKRDTQLARPRLQICRDCV